MTKRAENCRIENRGDANGMLHALTSLIESKPERSGAPRALASPAPQLVAASLNDAQATYGNQAMLRMLSRSSGVGGRSIQRKAGCGCVGSTSQGKGKQLADRFHERGVDEEETNEFSDQGIVLMQEDTKPVPPGSGTCI